MALILECKIDIRTDLNRSSSNIREPVFFKYSRDQYKLMVPDDGELKFKKGETALIACTSESKPNSLTFSKLKGSAKQFY